MLYHSGQPQILFPDAIKEARELPENPSELELQAALGNLLANNIGFAWELLTENSLKEFQEFVLKSWWKKDYNLFVAARGTGKSFLIAIFCILYCIFNPGKKVCIVSSNFRRSKAIILQIERFVNAKGKNFLRPCFPDIFSSKQNDRYSVKFNNGSEVSGLPLGCVKGDTKVINLNKIGPIEDLFSESRKSGDVTVNGGKVWSNGEFRTSEFNCYNGVAKTKRITTKKGYEIEATCDHKIKCIINGEIIWKELQHLLPGERILIDRQPKWVESLIDTDIEKSYLLGLMLGDGSFVNDYYLQFTSNDIELAESVRRISGGKWLYKGDCHYQEFGRAIADGFRKEWGVGKLYTEDKYIPKKIFESNKGCIRACLQGLFDTDGGVQVSTSKGGYGVTVSFYNTSKKLIDDIQYSLLNFGIVCKKTLRYKNTNKLKNKDFSSCYTLSITGRNAKIFAEEIGFRLERKQSLLLSGIRNQNKDVSYLDGIPGGKELALDLAKSMLGVRVSNRPINIAVKDIKRLSILTFDKAKQILDFTAEYLGNDPAWIKLNNIANPNIYYDELDKIQDGECETFDLHVSDGHEYNANGFFGHNTGEGLRGERANVLIIDEGLLISRHIRETVLEPFILANLDLTEQTKIKERETELIEAGEMKEEDRTRFASNKIIVCSSASFQWEPLYEDIFIDQIKKINEHSRNKNDPSYSVIRCSYHIGMKHGIIEESAIKKVGADSIDATTDPVLGREYWGIFVDGSGGFFPLRTIKECTVPGGDSPTVQLFGRKGSQYILAIDPSFASGLDSDYFAMGVYLLIPEEKRMVQVLTYGRAGGDVSDHYQFLTYILKYFNIVFCIIDATSTNAQFITQYNESSIALENNTKLGFLEVDFEDDEYVKQLHAAKSQWNVEKRVIVYKFVFGSATIRKTHEFLKSQIDSRKVWFGSPISQNKEAFGLYKTFKVPYILKDSKGKPFDGIIDYIEDCDDWIRRTQDQIALIQVKISAHGSMSFDLPSYCARNEDPDRPRKDNFSALVMGCYAAKFVFDMYDLSMEQPPQMAFMPTFI